MTSSTFCYINDDDDAIIIHNNNATTPIPTCPKHPYL